MKKSLNTTLVYILSILGLLCCCFWGLGVFLSGPAYLTANKKVKDAQLNPEDYEGNINSMQTAKTFALIFLIINTLFLAWAIYSLATTDFSEIQQEWQKIMDEINAAK